MEEVVADSCEQMLTSGDTIERLMELRAADRTVFDKVKNFIRSMAEKVRKVYQGLRPDTVEARYVATMLDAFDQLQQLWVEGVAGAAEKYGKAEIFNHSTADSTTMYSIKNTSKMTLDEQLRNLNNGSLKSSDSLYFGETPTAIYKAGLDSLPLAFRVSDYKKSTKEKHNVPRRAIKNLSANLSKPVLSFGDSQRVGFLVDDIDGDGKPLLVGIEKNVTMDNRKVNAIRSTYGLDNPAAWIQNQIDAGKEIIIYDERKADSFLRSYGYKALQGENNQLTLRMVSQPGDTVKEKLLSDRDNDYLKAVQDGDTETAQRMVDDAAKKAGYSVRMFHGAKKGGGFTVFRDWSYFTQNEAYARRYMNQSNREDGDSLYSVYVKLGKTFDTRKARDRKLFNQIRQEMGLGEIGERGLPDWTDGYDLSEYIEENELPYDCIVLDEGGDMVNGKPVYRGESYVVRDSSSVKSAAPVTYDDDGNVIPLSQRFQKEQKDIRYSARETEVSQAETDLEAEERYSYKNLPADAFYKDGRIYDYDFLTAQKDMVVLKNLPSLNDVKTNNRIDNDKVVSMGIQSCLGAGAKKVGNRYAVKNTYTGRNLMVGDNSITHGLGNVTINDYRTNARLGAIIGDICKNAIPINGLPNTHRVAGTYAMVAVVESTFNDIPAPLIARLVVEQSTNVVESVDFIDAAHAISGRVQKNNEERRSAQGTPVDETSRGATHLSSTMSIYDLLQIVNDTHQGFLSDDVIEKLGVERRGERKGLFSDRESASDVRKQWDDEDFSSDMMEHGDIFENIFKNFGILL